MTCRAVVFLGCPAVALGFLTACGPQAAAPKAVAPTTIAAQSDATEAGMNKEAASFDSDKGLFLPEATRQAMGVTTGSVQKKTFQGQRTMKLQVFRESDEQPLPGMPYRSGYAYASTILPGHKLDLQLGQQGEVMEKQNVPTGSTGKIFQVNALPNSNQTEVLVEMADPRHQFALSAFCSVHWQLPAVEAPTAVPDSAVLKTTEGEFVYLEKDDRFVRTAVKLGASGEGFTEIAEGVAVGDVVVTNPVQTLWLTELKLKSGSEP